MLIRNKNVILTQKTCYANMLLFSYFGENAECVRGIEHQSQELGTFKLNYTNLEQR